MIEHLLVILPSEEITASVESFYHDFELYRHTTLPPHITVLPPFTATDLSHEKLLNLLIKTFSGHPSIEINLDQVGVFRGRNNVVFLSTSPASATQIFRLVEISLAALGSDIELPREFIQKETFRSHLTLAKHVPKNELNSIRYEAKKRFSPATFTCTGLALFKNENTGRGWKKISNIKF